MNVKAFVKSVIKTINKQLPNVFTVGVVIGTGATAYFSGKSVLRIDSILKENGDNPISRKTAVNIVKASLPTAGAVAFTIGCAIASNRIFASRLSLLNKVYIQARYNLTDYKVAAAVLGGGSTEAIRNKISENLKFEENDLLPSGCDLVGLCSEGETKYVFYDTFSKRRFVSTLSDVYAAEYEVNRFFANEAYCTLNEFYKLLEIPGTKIGECTGWDYEDIYEGWCWTWIHFYNERHEEADGTVWYEVGTQEDTILFSELV